MGETGDARQVFATLIGDRLRSLRIAKGLTIRDVSDLADVSETLVTQVELGIQVPRGDSLVRMLAILGATLDDVAGDYYGLYKTRAQRVLHAVEETHPSKLLERPATASPARVALAGGRGGSSRGRSSSSPSSNTNARRKADPRRWGLDQPNVKPRRNRREGGFPTPAALRAATLAEVA